jgi:hypothetical protein
MIECMRGWVVVAGVIAATTHAARADERLEDRWPAVPPSHQLKLDDRIADRISELGNQAMGHVDLLSHGLIRLHFDARGGRAWFGVGGGNARYLAFRLDTDWFFAADGVAHVHARVDLGIAGHRMHLELPQMDVSGDSYHNAQLVQVNVPLLSRHF